MSFFFLQKSARFEPRFGEAQCGSGKACFCQSKQAEEVLADIPASPPSKKANQLVGFFIYATVGRMQYEIEIKALLGSQEATDNILEKVRKLDPNCTVTSEQKQRNHYFKDGDLAALVTAFRSMLTPDQVATLTEISKRATSINVRSRQKNDEVLLIVKGSLDATSAVHSHQRMEFEAPLAITIEQLDEMILSTGWRLEAKWQAERTIYTALGLTLDVFFTPGYGYMIEFEKVITDDTDRETAHQQVVDVMHQLGVSELPNDRLERMFAYYNEHWPEYYGTRNIFTIE